MKDLNKQLQEQLTYTNNEIVILTNSLRVFYGELNLKDSRQKIIKILSYKHMTEIQNDLLKLQIIKSKILKKATESLGVLIRNSIQKQERIIQSINN